MREWGSCCEAVPAMDELQQLSAHLRDLGRDRPTARRRAEVEALLDNKWEGIQVQAAHVLGMDRKTLYRKIESWKREDERAARVEAQQLRR